MVASALTASAPRRVTVVAPHTRADLALPAEATLAEVLPQLIELVGIPLEDPTGSAGGWALSRLGAEPFPAVRSVGAAGIVDGDVLYLTPASARMPPVVFDDVIEAIAGAPESSPGRWGPRSTRLAGLATAVLAAGAGLAALWTSGPPWGGGATIAAVVAVLLVGGAAAVSRALGDPTCAAMVAGLALAYAATAGALAPLGAAPRDDLGRAGLLLAATGLLVGGLAAVGAVGAHLPWLAMPAVGGLVALVAVGVGVVLDVPSDRLAAVTGTMLVALTPAWPALALRAARLPLPRVPADVAEFQAEQQPTLDHEVLDQTADADGFLSALLGVSVLGVAACAPALVDDHEVWAGVLVVLWATGLALRSRSYVGAAQRGPLLAGGVLTMLAVLLTVLLPARGDALALLMLLLVVVVAAGVGFALWAPGKSRSPYWGRFLDIVEFLAAAGAFPLVAVVLDLFGWMRGLAG